MYKRQAYRGNLVFTAGPPSGGGITLLTALNILSYFGLGELQSDSTITYHLLAEAERRGHNNRSHFVGDPKYFNVPVKDLLSKERNGSTESFPIYGDIVIESNFRF